METVAIIPARGGSKRLPSKNKLNFYGKPILAYTIEAALSTNLFSQVVVSTEDEEIATIADRYGAVVDVRKEHLATDASTVAQVCLDYIDRYPNFQTLCVLYPTAVLRSSEDIKAVVGLLADDCDCAFAVTNYYYDLHKALAVEDRRGKPLFPDLVNKRKDGLPNFCVDNGSTYAVKVESFMRDKVFCGDDLRVHIMPRSRSVDINEKEDFELAKFYASRQWNINFEE